MAPTRVAETCAKCHADKQRMAEYALPDGRPFPTDQFAGWSSSVHAAAMRDRGDLSAPTCNDCHGNHGATPPGIGATSFVCGQCHGREAELFRSSAKSHAFSEHQQLLAEAEGLGLTGTDRFDWLIDRAQSLPTHSDVGEDGSQRARPEFARLFSKFRLGKTTVEVRDAATGRMVNQPLRRCVDCHGPDDTSGGFAAARQFADRLQELTALIGRAERIVLTGRRGGVPVGDANQRIDAAIDAQIQLQVLVHSFDPDGDFAAKHGEGVAHARAALAAGQGSLDELRFRHRGLGVSLAVIVLVLVALALKIRLLPPG